MKENSESVLNAVVDPGIRSLLLGFHRAASEENEQLAHELSPYFDDLENNRVPAWRQIEQYLDDKYICLDPAEGVFCYLIAKAIGARRIVEFGTSFGVSTIYLSMAVRDNGGGLVIGTEVVAEKARRARENVARAGLSKFVEIRVGDAHETLRDLEGPIDFFLCDGFPRYQLSILKLVAPRLRTGGVVVTDRVDERDQVYRSYLEYLRDPGNGFQSTLIGLDRGTEGTEFSVKVGKT